jgi:hypothetical protein
MRDLKVGDVILNPAGEHFLRVTGLMVNRRQRVFVNVDRADNVALDSDVLSGHALQNVNIERSL